MRLVIALLVWAAAAGGAVELSSAVARSVGTTRTFVDGRAALPGSGGAPAGGSSVNPESVTGSSRMSLFRSGNLNRALRVARRTLGPNAHVESVVIYPGYLTIIGVKHTVTVSAPYKRGVSATSTGAAVSERALFSLRRVSADGPSRLVRHIAAAGHVSAAHLRYIAVATDAVSRQLSWYIYPGSGSRVTYFRAAGPRGPLLELPAGGSGQLQPVGG